MEREATVAPTCETGSRENRFNETHLLLFGLIAHCFVQEKKIGVRIRERTLPLECLSQEAKRTFGPKAKLDLSIENIRPLVDFVNQKVNGVKLELTSEGDIALKNA